jgi:hypothetical protein
MTLDHLTARPPERCGGTNELELVNGQIAFLVLCLTIAAAMSITFPTQPVDIR